MQQSMKISNSKNKNPSKKKKISRKKTEIIKEGGMFGGWESVGFSGNKQEREERERERERDFMAILDGLHHGITTILAAAY